MDRPSLAAQSNVVSCAGHTSSSLPVTSGLPQGSVLGPLVFCIYTQLLDAIIQRHNFSFHNYASGTPLYLSFDPFIAQAAAC